MIEDLQALRESWREVVMRRWGLSFEDADRVAIRVVRIWEKAL